MPFSHKNFACKITIFTSKISRKRQKWKNEWPEKFGTRSRFPAICWRCSRIKKFEKIHRLRKRKTISNTDKGISASDKEDENFVQKIIRLKIKNSSTYVLTLILGVNFKLEEKSFRMFIQFRMNSCYIFLHSKMTWNWLKLYMNDLDNGWTSTKCLFNTVWP